MDQTPNPLMRAVGSTEPRDARGVSESPGRALNIFSDRFDPTSPRRNIKSPLAAIRDSPVGPAAPAGPVGGAEEAKEVESNGNVEEQVSSSPARGFIPVGLVV